MTDYGVRHEVFDLFRSNMYSRLPVSEVVRFGVWTKTVWESPVDQVAGFVLLAMLPLDVGEPA